MQCKTDDCTNEAIAKVIFPWSAGEGETVACQTHVDAAKQLMANLNRSDELQVLPLVAPGVELVTTAEPAPVAAAEPPPAAAAPRPTEERLTHQLRAQCLAMELDLEKLRGQRITAELELVRQARAAFDHFAEQVKDFVEAQLPGVIEQVKAAAAEAREPGDCDDLSQSVVDGEPTTARLSPPESSPTPGAPPESASQAPAPPPGPAGPPSEP